MTGLQEPACVPGNDRVVFHLTVLVIKNPKRISEMKKVLFIIQPDKLDGKRKILAGKYIVFIESDCVLGDVDNHNP